MTGSNDPPGGPAGPSGRRRPPTIDLTATEIPPEPASPNSSATAETSSAAAASAGDTRRRSALDPLSAGWPWPLIAAGGAGAALTVVVLTLAGAFSARDNPAAIPDARLGPLEQQVRELAARPQPSPSDARAVDDLAGRLARLETIIATPKPPVADPALANRLATLEGDLRALGERVSVLARRSDESAAVAAEARSRADALAAAIAELRKGQAAATAPVAGRAELDALARRVTALEDTIKSVTSELGTHSVAAAGTDRALRLVVVATALEAAIDRGAPFTIELAAARIAASEPKRLATLEPFAASGVPAMRTLARELTALVPALAKAAGTTTGEGGLLDRLKANAERIVRIRPIEEAVSDEPAAIVRRIESRAERGDLAGAIAEIAKLPPQARELTKAWRERVEARDAAIGASRGLVLQALAALGKPSP
ncbi:MAG: hypothetical protein IT536_05725 [Hyphomicrobiales bacterium]|nr:hypothetical protein [Hyphomicrobiales bacterium]